MRVFVAIITSGTPAAINQLVLTQLYNPAGTAHTLALFLSLQCELFVHPYISAKLIPCSLDLVMPILTT